MRKAVIIVAGGKGLRFGGELPKQFMLLHKRPVIMHTIEAFYRFDNNMEFVLVLPVAHLEYWTRLTEQYMFSIKHHVVAGGETRFQSVKNGLNSIKSADIIGIHDGVRPLVNKETIEHCYKTAMEKGNAIPVVGLSDSIREMSNNISKPVRRDNYCLIQTPQVFRADILRKAYLQEYAPEYTDDATVVEKLGYTINLVEGNRENIKITNPMDMTVAEALFHSLG